MQQFLIVGLPVLRAERRWFLFPSSEVYFISIYSQSFPRSTNPLHSFRLVEVEDHLLAHHHAYGRCLVPLAHSDCGGGRSREYHLRVHDLLSDSRPVPLHSLSLPYPPSRADPSDFCSFVLVLRSSFYYLGINHSHQRKTSEEIYCSDSYLPILLWSSCAAFLHRVLANRR